ncbi:MAG: hypothetical protein ACRDNH_08470 [Gaiellaceae bacterium]
MTVRTTATIGTVAILVALVLVPAVWHCSGAIEGWNFVIYVLLAAGGSIVGSAAGRVRRSRLVGIATTVLVVAAALFVVSGLAALVCD